MNEQQPQAEAALDNVHPAEAGLEATIDPNTVELDAKERLVLGYFRDVIDVEFTEQGIQFADNTVNELATRFDRIKHGAVLAQRGRLEKDPTFRHPIPYIPIHRHNAEGQIELFVYQRTKKVGEEKLYGKHSLAVGGHPEAPSMRFHPNWSIDGGASMMACLVSELDEEVTFDGIPFSDFIKINVTTYGHEGFIRDDSNEVGKQHLGVLFSIGVQEGVEVQTIEPELITVGFMTLEKILSPDSGLDLENWSYMLANAYAREIEAANKQAAADADVMAAALAEANTGLEPAPRMRGENPHVIHVDELPFMAVDPTLEMDPSNLNLDPSEPLRDETRELYKQHAGVDLDSLVMPEGGKLVSRGLTAFLEGTIEHPTEGVKALNIMLDPCDPDPVSTIESIIAEIRASWAKEGGERVQHVQSVSRDETGAVVVHVRDEQLAEALEVGDIGRGTVMETHYNPELDSHITQPAKVEFRHREISDGHRDNLDRAMRESHAESGCCGNDSSSSDSSSSPSE